MAKMELYKGTYYTPEDLEREKAREAKVEKRARAEAGIGDLSPASNIGDEPVAVFVARVVSEAIAPLADRVAKLESETKALGEALSAAAGSRSESAEGDPASTADSAASDDSAKGAESEESTPAAEESVPAEPKKPTSRGGRSGKAPVTAKDGE